MSTNLDTSKVGPGFVCIQLFFVHYDKISMGLMFRKSHSLSLRLFNNNDAAELIDIEVSMK